ncbi:vitamin B12-dependent ribonucleotide reductase [Sediminibacterium soli]|uniref:vitamin B12-dependent ribonucleotide reductase n=1 Tax=Sediminibacterium soli TaxID=2698829 RepID=UPI00137AD4F5|nr:vitamin B12-dependent ribonucleotide reductase [Sediminibacterium soli]NCI47309.1 vitamin B12-dependent ribonucleotide reductase [Sediminibacterium soli]
MSNPRSAKGLSFSRRFTKEGVSPFDMFEYDYRDSVIKNPTGEKVFEMNNVEVPRQWSQIATDILAQKYFRKAGVPQPDGSVGRETSVKQVAHRMANCWRVWGERYGYFKSTQDAGVFYDELVYSILNQACVPNSPQWFNTGLHESYGITGKPQGHYYVDPKDSKLKKSANAYERPQPHACFILSVSDDLVNEGGIMDLWTREARIFKYGSGVGTNFSQIRGSGEKLSGGGSSSGLMSFLKIGDRAAGAIKSGGTTRRAAKMVCLDLDHPEVMDFINWKVEEEKKVAALVAAGYDNSYEGEAYATVSGQNSNNSVRIPNSFFRALEEGGDWELKARTDGRVMKKVPAREVWDKIAYAAWRCADPGTQYDTTINEWHTCPKGGRINASNPCSEYMFLDNTACNLASINLRRFHNDDTNVFDVEGFEYTTRLWTTVLEVSVLMAQFPSKDVAQLSYDYRTLGLGFANLGSMLMVSGISYDSEEARGIAGAISAIMTGIAYKTSAEMASFLGAFDKYEENKEDMLRVMRNHRAAAYDAEEAYVGIEIKPQGIKAQYCPDYLLKAATKAWDEAVQLGEKHGYRNAQTTVIAPTGTIGLVMDCDTTGVEPDFALVKFKKLSGGGYFKIINQSVPQALHNLGYNAEEADAIEKYAVGAASFNGAPFINPESLKAKGFSEQEIEKLNGAAKSAFEIGFLFNRFTLGDECLQRLGFTEAQYSDWNFSMLEELGFTEEQIDAANDYVCGTMTVEGAPFLKDEHLTVFDCANKCGKKGERYIHAYGHIRMMGACQPFLSGAISKTINLPHEASVEEIADCYMLSWQLGLKANALYRDGSKLSQPLSNKSDKKKKTEEATEAGAETKETAVAEAPVSQIVDLSTLTVDELLEEVHKRMQASTDTKFKRALSGIVEKKSLPAKRRGFTQKAKIGGQVIFLRTGEYSDGTLGEIFIDLAKEGSTLRSFMNCFAIAISVGLQYGVPLEEFVEKFVFTKFEPSGMVDHPNIKTTTSLVDFVFRALAFEYLGRTDLVHVLDKPSIGNTGEGDGDAILLGKPELSSVRITAPSANSTPAAQPQPQKLQRAAAAPMKAETGMDAVNAAAKNMQSDAPACNTCGHITIRSGTCYKCLNCGNSMGCS